MAIAVMAIVTVTVSVVDTIIDVITVLVAVMVAVLVVSVTDKVIVTVRNQTTWPIWRSQLVG